MSKITNCILMLELLQNNNLYSVKELSEELGVSERMVRYYKEQLELAGYDIQSFKGPGGGYFINKKNNIKLNYFNKYDLELLESVKDYLDETSLDENIKKSYEVLNEKLHTIYNTNKILSEFKEIDVNIKNVDEKIKCISECIKNKNSLLITNLSVDGILTRREIVPISFFEFNNVVYVTAFCKLRGDIRHFPLSHILKYEII